MNDDSLSLEECRVKNYYIFKWLVKNNPGGQISRVEDLYIKFFPTKKGNGNRSLYDRILNIDADVDLNIYAEQLEELTGLNKDYFTGKKDIFVNGINNNDWKKFIKARKNKQNNLRPVIEQALKENLTNISGQSTNFAALAYFFKNGTKQLKDTTIDVINEVLSRIVELENDKSALLNIDSNILNEYFTKLVEHCKRIKVISIFREWKD